MWTHRCTPGVLVTGLMVFLSGSVKLWGASPTGSVKKITKIRPGHERIFVIASIRSHGRFYQGTDISKPKQADLRHLGFWCIRVYTYLSSCLKWSYWKMRLFSQSSHLRQVYPDGDWPFVTFSPRCRLDFIPPRPSIGGAINDVCYGKKTNKCATATTSTTPPQALYRWHH